jgi:putative transposase
MKKKRFSIEQIVAALKQAELGMPVADLIPQVGISEQTFYRWKKLVAELSMNKAILQDVASKKCPGPR